MVNPEGGWGSRAQVQIVGAGFAGLSAAITLAKLGIASNLFSVQPSERAQSVLAEGGINAALDTAGEADSPREHFADTMRGGAELADPNMVRGLAEAAPGIVRWLRELGAAFRETPDGEIALRRFGGQKKRRTAYARSSTGKVMMTALIDEARKHEAEGKIRRYPHHTVLDLAGGDPGGLSPFGILVRDDLAGGVERFAGPVILACGGLGGLFAEQTTGTVSNTGDLCAAFYAQGGELGNLEFIQYHPTTARIPGKRLLVSEAARGEGGRLFLMRGGERWYFLEERYPELGNLMPRDVVSREMVLAAAREDCEDTVCLDLTGVSPEVWGEDRRGRKPANGRLSDLREELIRYLGIDPAREPVPVQPGIHYFMGGILVDEAHRTSLPGVYAAGECACAYHGANRLGGNSMLAALYGGRIAAQSAAREWTKAAGDGSRRADGQARGDSDGEKASTAAAKSGADAFGVSAALERRLSEILSSALGILREEESLSSAIGELEELLREPLSEAERRRVLLGEAMLRSARERRESRGAHTRTDYPERRDAEFQKTTVARLAGGRAEISFREIPGERGGGEADGA